MSLECETLNEKGVVLVLVKGELVADNARRLSEHLDELLNEGNRNFVIDLQHLVFLDSTGMGSLVRLHKNLQAAGGRARLCCVLPDVQRIFELTRLDKLFDLFNDQKAAIESLSLP